AVGLLGVARTCLDGALRPTVGAGPCPLGRRRPGRQRALSPDVSGSHLRPGDVRAHAHAAAVVGGADADGEVLCRATRLSPRGGRLDPSAGDTHYGGRNFPHELVSPPVAAPFLAARWGRGL